MAVALHVDIGLVRQGVMLTTCASRSVPEAQCSEVITTSKPAAATAASDARMIGRHHDAFGADRRHPGCATRTTIMPAISASGLSGKRLDFKRVNDNPEAHPMSSSGGKARTSISGISSRIESQTRSARQPLAPRGDKPTALAQGADQNLKQFGVHVQRNKPVGKIRASSASTGSTQILPSSASDRILFGHQDAIEIPGQIPALNAW